MNLTEKQIREIANQALVDLGENASPDSVKRYIEEKITNYTPQSKLSSVGTSGKAILTSFGLDRPGVVASVTKLLSDSNCDILDISQKIMQQFFTLIILIDISASEKTLKELQDELSTIAESLKIKIYLQHEDIFTQMHRI